jgi:hypothetical protein
MNLISRWFETLKKNQAFIHSSFIRLYFILPLILIVTSLIDGMPLFSLKETSTISSIFFGIAILLSAHLSCAGAIHSYSTGETEKATSISFYGGVVLFCLILIVP